MLEKTLEKTRSEKSYLYRPGVAVLGGKIYVLGGEEGWDHYHDTIECYDPVADKWELVGEMGSSRSWLSCVGKQKKGNISRIGFLSKNKIRDLFKLVLFGLFSY